MPNPIRFVLALHNHQPIGNFDHVFEQAYQESYRPFLETFGRHPALRIALHTSGSLMEWLDARHPEYVDQLADLVAHGRIEIVGGPFFEPILAMIPSRDRIGQIRSYKEWLSHRLGASVRGMWMPERVWEQSYTRDLAAAGIEYTILDDYHFKNAGLAESQLHGYYVTEDDGRMISVFPGSERLRYLIPFGQPQDTIDHLARIADEHPNSVVVFGDDGEKFGTWPETYKHCYEDGWLEHFLGALEANQDWLKTTTLSEAIDHLNPLGKIYLPDSSYREMTEWALPSAQQDEYDRMTHDMEHDPRWPAVKRFIRGGFWRNFKIKYAESDEMYARMMAVSRKLEQAVQAEAPRDIVDRARAELYRGQCNCSYWHGAFGGIYLPHLRNAVYRHLIAADNLLNQAAGRDEPWIEAKADDFNFDGSPEIQLANDQLHALLSPRNGGLLYELDVRSICHNLLATMTRRAEVYHRKILAGSSQNGAHCASIHDRIVCKQEGLNERIQYDAYPRKSLVDLFYDEDATLEAIATGRAVRKGDFFRGEYDARVRRNPDRIQVFMTRQGEVDGARIRISKGVTLNAGSPNLEIAYFLEGLPQDRPLHFGVEFNFAGLPAGADDRYFHELNSHDHNGRLGQLGTRLDLHRVEGLGLVDEWLGIGLNLTTSIPASIWTYPVESVSGSEGGFELVHQSVVVQPHWLVVGDNHGRWAVTLNLAVDTSRAENRREQPVYAMS
jgi:alpha-amylase